MANSATLSDLQAQALDLADLTNSASPVTARLTDYINAALGELNDILVNSFEDYIVSTQTVSLVAGTQSYNLATDYYKTIKVYFLSGTDRYRLRRFSLNELDLVQGQLDVGLLPASTLSYAILGNKIWFAPIPSIAGTVEHWYAPQLTKLSSGSDTVHVSVPIGWEDFVALAAAVKLRVRDQQDAGDLQALKMEAKQRILACANDRDAGEPHRIIDTSARFDPRRRNGWRY